ncbi:hypothetical protein [Candidatus Berkiella aquae]|uniref:Uncharacterized protein n=1 Tax=Candidatus Berkiella aquae TaxID=295108 RepID=A0A0Q9YST4_9GAMM|nr:hypothetical protein [Candidatus Berkiella aquae]MCS5710644.1 hypothetical protein [Candidatus Berkiella aquae]
MIGGPFIFNLFRGFYGAVSSKLSERAVSSIRETLRESNTDAAEQKPKFVPVWAMIPGKPRNRLK